ncbi:right-handed parallel beta-helix repeat-containing protein [Spongiibacter sp. KMU-158]|uniref:Right-handed parallel beta-helix repeat-containing protein n=1 Tax=Spongiibacter pelagi TaxID=2760804 RepID=A0A927C1D5_9GAMM|nr:parallel beta-helix domain-containing protein [Spongiibacter pelagi]MBD2857861.1 right-handed parallel beta-helix repeat-containing protein [Spongiibacter pelagi]
MKTSKLSAISRRYLVVAALILAAITSASAAEIRVKDGQSIQDAVNRAVPGDVILVEPGTYKESVYVDKDKITLRGVVEEGKWPVMEGEGKRNDAILYSGNDFTVEWMWIQHYKGNAIMGQAGNNYVIRYNRVVDTGVYGIFPQLGQNGLIEYNVLDGIEDAAIYVGMCDNVVVRYNEVFNNVAGIEIENTRHAIVENNYAHNNTAGLLVFITPGLPIKTTYDVIIRNNFSVNNNTPNFGAPGSIVSKLPPGLGVVIMAADDVIVEGNIITGNDTAGVVITDLNFITDIASDPESEPNPDRIAILDNFFMDNGKAPVADVKAAMMTQFKTRGPDVLANFGSAQEPDNCILNKDRYVTFGLKKWGVCERENTHDIDTYLLADGAPPRPIETDQDLTIRLYKGICAGCHALNMRMIGPPTLAIQALYHNNPQGIADYIAAPHKVRPDFPEMPPQGHLSEELRLRVAEYMLSLEKPCHMAMDCIRAEQSRE